MPRPKLLVVTRHSPLPENDGAGAYLFDLLSYLASRGARIEVAWVHAEGAFVRRGWWRVPSRLSRVFDLRIIGSLAVGPYRFFWWGPYKARVFSAIKTILIQLRLWRGGPSFHATGIVASPPLRRPPAPKPAAPAAPEWSALPTDAEAKFYRQERRRFRPDAVLANYCWMTPLLAGDRDVTRLVLTHDVASHRLNLPSFAPRTVDENELSPATPEGEKRLLDQAEVILAISEEDAATFRAFLPGKTVLVATKSAPVRPLAGSPVGGRCLFVGAANTPNREGLQWFLEKVWPLVHAARPEASLHLCGAICETLPAQLPDGVVARGRVPDLSTEYAQAELVVVPLLQGTGVKIKLVEACSYGKPCVTTPVGLQGLAFLRDAVIESVVPEEFAQGMLRVLSDPALRAELSARTRQRVAENLSPEHCYNAVWEALSAPRSRVD